MVKINLSQIVETIKDSDQRFRENTTEQAIKNNIQSALTSLAVETLAFTMSETITLEDEFEDNDSIYFNPTYEIIDYYDIYFQNIVSKDIFYHKTEVTNSKTIYIRRNEFKNIKNLALVMKYYYVPVLTDEEYIFIEPEMYNIFIELVLAYMWKYYKDFEKYNLYYTIVKEKLSIRTNASMPKDYIEPSIRAKGFE
jgi:hypothetical protein